MGSLGLVAGFSQASPLTLEIASSKIIVLVIYMLRFPIITKIASVVIQHQPLSDLIEHRPEALDVGMNVS